MPKVYEKHIRISNYKTKQSHSKLGNKPEQAADQVNPTDSKQVYEKPSGPYESKYWKSTDHLGESYELVLKTASIAKDMGQWLSEKSHSPLLGRQNGIATLEDR